jgi:hypothetical protein
MKLGISYSVFDSEELLEGSIKQIRPCVDYINVIFQKTSNCGNQCSPDALKILKELKQKKLIDNVFLYEPRFDIVFNQNEVIKRNIGLAKCREQNCTHHMTMDADEYFITEQFNKVKNIIDKHNFDSSFCQMQTYYKDWSYVFETPEEYYVPLIYKIKPYSEFIYNLNQIVLTDPSRRLFDQSKPVVFKRETIEMHHGSYIRKDIKTKLINSSAKLNYEKDIDALTKHYNSWSYPQLAYCAGVPSTYHKLKQINPLF